VRTADQVISAMAKAKRDARILKVFLKENGIAISRQIALEATSRLKGYRDWAALRAAAQAASQLAPDPDSVANWVRFVFCIEEVEDNSQEAWFYLPAGTSLKDKGRYTRLGLFKDHDRVLVPQPIDKGACVVATMVYSLVPNVGKYGLPWFARDDLAAAWFREEIGIAALDDVHVQYRDMGNDGGSRYWFEARVHPSLAEALLRRQGMLTVFAGVFAEVGVDTGGDNRGAELDPILTALEHGLGSGVAEQNAERYLAEMVNALVTLNDPYATYSVTQLYTYLVGAAKHAAEQHRAKNALELIHCLLRARR
jgi:hypothetical protein